MCARDGDLLALAPVLFVFAFVTRNAFSQSQSSAGRPARLCRTKILVRRVGPRAASAGAMAAQQPPRPTPNNLLFCGPPPALPHVLLLPNEATRTVTHFEAALIADNQTNDTDALREINNVGLPTYEGIFHDPVQVFDENQNMEYQLPPENYLRRTQSFDVSDIYAAQIVNETDPNVFRQRRSEPDLSKYGLFAVSTECESQQMQHPALVLNNPFYDGSYALDPHQINQTMVALPENYLAFEDSFVPTWEYKPEFIIDRQINTEMCCDGLPLIPSNDPWSVYCNDFTAFQYFSPHYEASLGEDTIHYTPLTDLDYVLPQYMSLPVIEQANVESNVNSNNNYNKVEVANASSVINDPFNKHDKESNLHKTDVPAIDSVVSNVLIEDDKICATEFSIKESSTQSEESFNADISNDVTSSLAFLPSSKSSQRPGDADDTSEDTSPCSTDYHEASALDLVQSLDELSCCNSTDYSQSRDDVSPTIPELPKTVKKENQDSVSAVSNATNISNLPLNQVPSIPLHDRTPGEMPPIQNSLPEREPVQTNMKVQEEVSQCAESTKNLENRVQQDVTKTNNTQQCRTNSQTISELCACENNHIKVIDNALKTSQQPPFPPAVPTSWLATRPSGNQINLVRPPQIRVQKADGVVTDKPQSPKVAPHPAIKISQSSTEPQPSCSYVQAQPAAALQLKPEKQTKEVEVSLHIIVTLTNI
ncbi:unnamed protein product [Arctia plantaginis]|uniref:Uncharacterized protein n=1 Tax=Arctia plantaginis TaxID=874455 RepID=A0A8S1AUE4_ARCPL|nr:unnamed protein product [Arctia plantaginis]CAB3250445.1 unnamed protein product [Arctia plantaginis]